MIINILKYGISEGVAKLAPFITTLYVAKFLSPELFGKYSLIVVMFEITFILISFNIQATTRIDFFKLEPEQFFKSKQNHLFISIIFAFLILSFFILFMADDWLVGVILVISAFFRSISMFLQAIFQCSKKINLFIASNMIFVFSLSVGVFIFLQLGFLYFSWLYAVLLASFIQIIASMSFFGVRKLRSFIPREISISSLKLTFIPAALFMPQAIGWWLKSGADRAIISQQLGDDVLGNFSLSFQLASIMLICASVLNLALVPEINKLLKENKITHVIKYIKRGALLVLLVFLLNSIFGHFIISNYYVVEYSISLSLFHLLIFALLPQAIMLLIINILYFKGEGKFVAKLIFFSFLFQVVINYIYVHYYDIYGMIITSFIINFFVLTLVFIKTNKILKKVLYVKSNIT